MQQGEPDGRTHRVYKLHEDCGEIMGQKEIADKLKQLHELLAELEAATTAEAGSEGADDAAAHAMDDDTRALLTTVQRDIERLVGPHADTTPPEVNDQEVQSVTAGLQKALLDFEVQHPHLTSLLSRIGDALANLGI
jgi:hypothetical protein